MADVYLDNDVSLELAPLLRGANHNVTATRDLRLFQATDDAQLLIGTRNRWLLVTYNRRDFTMLHDAWLTWPSAFELALPAHPGLLVLNPATPATLASAVNTFLAGVRAESLGNELYWWHRSGQWHRRVVGVGWQPYKWGVV